MMKINEYIIQLFDFFFEKEQKTNIVKHLCQKNFLSNITSQNRSYIINKIKTIFSSTDKFKIHIAILQKQNMKSLYLLEKQNFSLLNEMTQYNETQRENIFSQLFNIDILKFLIKNKLEEIFLRFSEWIHPCLRNNKKKVFDEILSLNPNIEQYHHEKIILFSLIYSHFYSYSSNTLIRKYISYICKNKLCRYVVALKFLFIYNFEKINIIFDFLCWTDEMKIDFCEMIFRALKNKTNVYINSIPVLSFHKLSSIVTINNLAYFMHENDIKISFKMFNYILENDFDFEFVKRITNSNMNHELIQALFMNTSKNLGEETIYKYFCERNIFFIKCKPKNLNGLEIDFYNPDLNIAIEYNGIQHYLFPECNPDEEKKFLKQHNRDIRKELLCKKYNINLIIIKYSELYNLSNFLDIIGFVYGFW